MKAHSAAVVSLVVGVLVLGLKWLAFALTGSVSLYSDALESIVNVIAASIALFAVYYAGRPADVNHPFGHTKAEYFSAVLEGGLILFAAAEIVRAAYGRIVDPVPLQALDVGLGVSVGASVMNAGLAWFLVHHGRRLGSPALKADGMHVWTDVVTSAGVVAGVGLAWATGWWILDPLIAILVAVNILFVGWRLVRYSVGGLMDESVPDDRMARIEGTIREHMDGALEVHDVRTRRGGPVSFIEFHLVVPGTMTVDESHVICDRLEEALQSAIGRCRVSIHVEPEAKAKHAKGAVVRLGR